MTEPTDPYRSPSELSTIPPAGVFGVTPSLKGAVLRLVAALLAAGGTVWTLLCAALIISVGGFNMFSGVLFGPGFIVTCGYYWRALVPPSKTLCRVIWGCSLLVQGIWLAFSAAGAYWDQLGNGPTTPPAIYVAVLWWFSSTLLSLVGLCLDPGGQVEERRAAWPR